MNSFWKITRGELDKIFVRPAIFIMTGFFVLAIVVAALMFNPSPRADIANLANVESKSVIEVYNNFNSNQHKKLYDDSLEGNLKMLTFYGGSSTGDTVTKLDLTTQIADIKTLFDEYQSVTIVASTGAMNNAIAVNQQLKNSVNKLNSDYRNRNSDFLQLLIKSDNDETTLNLLNDFMVSVEVSGDTQSKEHHLNIIKTIDDNKFIPKLTELFDKIEQVEISDKVLTELINKYYIIAVDKTNGIWSEITNIYSDALLDNDYNLGASNIEKIKQLCDNYKLVTLQTSSIINDKILLEVAGDRATSTLRDYTYSDLSSLNKYQTKEDLVRNQFYFENGTYSYQYANVFQSNTNSNEKTNAYDFMYYALEFLSFIIVIFCVVIGSGMISGETSSGTMKMLAIRPYKRGKIMTGKLMATFFMGVIFLIIGTITTFIIGFRMYGLDSAQVLMVFNAESVTTISAIGLFFIFLATLLVRIILYTVFAVFVSTVFKSNIAAVIISVMVYVFVALFGNIFGSSAIYGYLPFANVDVFRYLGGEYVATSGNVLGLDFSCPIQPDSNFYLSIGISMGFVALLLVITYVIFKKRDIE